MPTNGEKVFLYVRGICATYHADGIVHVLAPNGDILQTLDRHGNVISKPDGDGHGEMYRRLGHTEDQLEP